MTIGALLGEAGVGHIPRRLVDNIRNEKYISRSSPFTRYLLYNSNHTCISQTWDRGGEKKQWGRIRSDCVTLWINLVYKPIQQDKVYNNNQKTKDDFHHYREKGQPPSSLLCKGLKVKKKKDKRRYENIVSWLLWTGGELSVGGPLACLLCRRRSFKIITHNAYRYLIVYVTPVLHFAACVVFSLVSSLLFCF